MPLGTYGRSFSTRLIILSRRFGATLAFCRGGDFLRHVDAPPTPGMITPLSRRTMRPPLPIAD